LKASRPLGTEGTRVGDIWDDINPVNQVAKERLDYRAERSDGFASFHGKRAGRHIAVGPVNMPVSRLFVEEIEVAFVCRR